MLLPAIHFYGFLLACIFTKSYLAFKNDATEILYSHVVKPAAASPSSNSTLNQARNGGRHYTSTGSDRNSEYPTGGTSSASRALRRRRLLPARPRERSPPAAAPAAARFAPASAALPGTGAPGEPGEGKMLRLGPGWDALGRAAPSKASLPRASPVGPALSGRLLPAGGTSRNAGFCGLSGGEARSRKRSERHFQSPRFLNSPSHCGQGRCLGYFSNAIKNSEFCSRCLVLLPAVAFTC